MNTDLPLGARRRVWAAALAIGLAATLMVAPLGLATETKQYDLPSSLVVRGAFGFGVLACATFEIPEEQRDQIRNGACFEYPFPGRPFFVSIEDDLFELTSMTVAVDVNGDGCVSDNCRGFPNDADYRSSGCGTHVGILPETEGQAPQVVQVFVRLVDVTPDDGEVCLGSSGAVTFNPA